MFIRQGKILYSREAETRAMALIISRKFGPNNVIQKQFEPIYSSDCCPVAETFVKGPRAHFSQGCCFVLAAIAAGAGAEISCGPKVACAIRSCS